MQRAFEGRILADKFAVSRSPPCRPRKRHEPLRDLIDIDHACNLDIAAFVDHVLSTEVKKWHIRPGQEIQGLRVGTDESQNTRYDRPARVAKLVKDVRLCHHMLFHRVLLV